MLKENIKSNLNQFIFKKNLKTYIYMKLLVFTGEKSGDGALSVTLVPSSGDFITQISEDDMHLASRNIAAFLQQPLIFHCESSCYFHCLSPPHTSISLPTLSPLSPSNSPFSSCPIHSPTSPSVASRSTASPLTQNFLSLLCHLETRSRHGRTRLTG